MGNLLPDPDIPEQELNWETRAGVKKEEYRRGDL